MPEPNFANRTLYHGDNLAVLRGMNGESVALIATDPPFNKGRDFHATPDSLAAGAKFQDRWRWDDDVEGEWIDQLQDDWPAVWVVVNAARSSWGDDLGAFLCYMAVRLVEMHRVLKSTGSIYLHSDPTASHYLKQLLDAIFGRRQFRNEIIWHYGKMSNTSSNFPRNHDIILRYTKSDEFCFNPIKGDESEYRNRYLRHLDANDCVTYGRVKTSTDKLILGRIKKVEKSLGRTINDNDVLFDFNTEFKTQSDVIYVPIIKGNAKERTGYPTQKPLALYEKLVTAASNPGDIVLDPFCGCATTPIAAERLSRQWVGIDIWDKAHELVIERLRNEGLAAPDGPSDRLFTFGDITYTAEPPVRTDDGETAAPFLQVTERYAEPDGPRMSRAEMYEYLLAQRGSRCQGCDRDFDDSRYLELDHNTPRSDGGMNHITNRVLLCGPCNRAKSNTYTLSGLRRVNKKNGWMARGRLL